MHLVPSPTPLPSHNAFNPSTVPCLFETVETDDDLLPPSELYKLAPKYLQYLANDSSGVRTSVKSLVAPHPVQQGGLSESAAALAVASPEDQTIIDELAYEKGDRLTADHRRSDSLAIALGGPAGEAVVARVFPNGDGAGPTGPGPSTGGLATPPPALVHVQPFYR
jgi:hypothetical protein